MGASNYVHLEDCIIKAATEYALLVEFPLDEDEWKEEWVPRSQISEAGDNLSVGDIGVTVTVSEWFAKKIGYEFS